METWLIIKEYVLPNGKIQPMVILDSTGEVWEFHNYEEAAKMAKMFETNSDSGWHYYTRKLHS